MKGSESRADTRDQNVDLQIVQLVFFDEMSGFFNKFEFIGQQFYFEPRCRNDQYLHI
jgi:hypothetical protein